MMYDYIFVCYCIAPLPRNIQHPYMAICSTSKKHTTSIYGNLFHFQETYNIHPYMVFWCRRLLHTPPDSCRLRQTPAGVLQTLPDKQESCRLCQTCRSPAGVLQTPPDLQESCRSPADSARLA